MEGISLDKQCGDISLSSLTVAGTVVHIDNHMQQRSHEVASDSTRMRQTLIFERLCKYNERVIAVHSICIYSFNIIRRGM